MPKDLSVQFRTLETIIQAVITKRSIANTTKITKLELYACDVALEVLKIHVPSYELPPGGSFICAGCRDACFPCPEVRTIAEVFGVPIIHG